MNFNLLILFLSYFNPLKSILFYFYLLFILYI